MHSMHFDNVDLNLLPALEALLEERQVSRAAKRRNLSQSAMSRVLARLRRTFDDELLVQTPAGYELTPRARILRSEMAEVMPQLRGLIAADTFDPALASNTMCLAASDYATDVLADGLFREFFRQAPNMSLTIDQVVPSTYEDMQRGRVDLVLGPLAPPEPMIAQSLFTDDLICLMSDGHPVTDDALTVEHLRAYPHARVAMLHGQQMLVDTTLAELGVHPRHAVTVPYFSTLIAALMSTTLIAVVPRRYALRHLTGNLRIASPPDVFASLDYAMLWHPRLTNDPAHQWLRTLLRSVSPSPLPGAERG